MVTSIPPPRTVFPCSPSWTLSSSSPAKNPKAFTFTDSPSSSSSGSIESDIAAQVLDMSTSPTIVLLLMLDRSLENEESTSSLDSLSLLPSAEEREDRKLLVLLAVAAGWLRRMSSVSTAALGRNLLGLLASGMLMLRGRALLGLTLASWPPCRSTLPPPLLEELLCCWLLTLLLELLLNSS